MFEVVGDTLQPRTWRAAGVAGPLTWTAQIDSEGENLVWRVRVEGTLTGPETVRGEASNAYAAGDACRAALRAVIDEHNRWVEITAR